MDNEELREAAEVAGLEVRDKAIAPGWEAGKHEPGCVWWWDDDDPALPAYIAELLVAMVRKRMVVMWPLKVLDVGCYSMWTSTAAKRIRAAMRMLKEEE